MVAALKACKQHFKVGCITNNVVSMHSPGQDEGQRAAGAMGQVMPLFDAIIESSKAGVRKPDPRIYLMMCELLAVAPAACVYLDDLGINCKPAAALGMTAIKVVDVDQTLADLAAATGLVFDGSPHEPAREDWRRAALQGLPRGARPRASATRSSGPIAFPISRRRSAS